MAINFPSNPQLDDTYTEGNRSWKWNGRFWQATSVTVGYTGSKGDNGTLNFKGSVATEQNLPLPYDGEFNDAYLVEETGFLWIWDGSSWGPIGRFTGYTGSRGVPGASVKLLGSVNTPQDLPQDGTSDGSTLLEAGDAYIAQSDGNLYVWNGSEFTNVGRITGETGPIGYTGSQGDIGYTGSEGLGLDAWIKVTSNYTATSGNRIIADTSGGTFTITLPLNPELGSYVVLTDGENWSSNLLIIDSGIYEIEGYLGGLDFDIGGVTTELLFDGTMWQVTATLGAEGPPGLGVPEGGTTGQILTKLSGDDYDAAWQNPVDTTVASIDDITDVAISNPSAGQILGYTGSNWTNQTGATGGGGADSYVKTYFWEGALQENVSLKRFYIHVTSTLEKITVNLGTAGLTQSTIQIKLNDVAINTIVIPAGTTLLVRELTQALAVNDYITVDITQSSSAANLYVTFVYRE